MKFSNPALVSRAIICILALFLPIFLWVVGGSDPKSYSEYYYSDAWPLYIGILGAVSYKMITNPKWRIPGILLAIVILFPCKEWKTLHNSSAIVFFLLSAWIICNDKRLYAIGWLMVICTPLYLINLYWVEVVEISLLCIFHLKYLIRLSRAKKDSLNQP